MTRPVPVELARTEGGWQLLRSGEPYFIRGAGGTHSLPALASAGGNSVRTWDAENVRGDDDVGIVLDEAQALGLTVTVGIWLGHERHGFDYSDEEAVLQQYQRARNIVLRYRAHPALLIWGIGNEMEGFEEGDNPAVWQAVNDIARMVKELDPNHPTMTVTAFVHGKRIDYVHRVADAIDIHGVNAYGGAGVVPAMLREGGATKPFILTEFGPAGPWESPATEWGAPIEGTSSEKADFYRDSYEKSIVDAPNLALGAYAFLWGHKVESTTTWFGMWLADGKRLAAVDTMSALWRGEAVPNRAPVVEPLAVRPGTTGQAGDILQVTANPVDPEGKSLEYLWELKADSLETVTGGDFRVDMPSIDGSIEDARLDGAGVRLPDAPGPYRLYYTVWDSAGGAATANLPLLVSGDRRMPMPMPVYSDGFEGRPWAPSGWMGNTSALTLDGAESDIVHSGRSSIRLRYEGVFGWVGVAWQHPPNDWGDLPGGFDLTGASALEVWARGRYGGEKVGFGVGLIEAPKPYPDSALAKLEDLVLTREWQRFRIPLTGLDLSTIKTGFFVTLTGRQSPVTVYLDDVRYVA